MHPPHRPTCDWPRLFRRASQKLWPVRSLRSHISSFVRRVTPLFSMDSRVQMQIRSAACPKCALCAGEGEFIYLAQRDRIFGAGGSWSYKKCSCRECGVIWLDPMPLADDLGKARPITRVAGRLFRFLSTCSGTNTSERTGRSGRDPRSAEISVESIRCGDIERCDRRTLGVCAKVVLTT